MPINARKGPQVPLGLERQMGGVTPPAWVLGNEFRVSGMLVKHSTNWATSLAPFLVRGVCSSAYLFINKC